MTATDLAHSHARIGTHPRCAEGDTSADDQSRNDPHAGTVVGTLDQSTLASDPIPAATDPLTPIQTVRVHRNSPDGGEQALQPPGQPPCAPHSTGAGWLELRLWAEMLNDALDARKATANRVRSATVDPAAYAPYLEAVEHSEKVVRRHLVLCYRRVVPDPIQAWVKASRGLGEPAIARLLGHIGDPRIAYPKHWEGSGSARHLVDDPPHARTLAQLWQYCGHGAPGRPTRGMSAEALAALGSPTAKSIVWNIAVAAMKTTGPYREVYDNARTLYADKEHTAECVRCGPSGKPKPVGSPWSPGHQHAAALRKVGKEVLRDLWIVSGTDQSPSDSHCPGVDA